MNSVQMPANANNGRSASRANYMTSFILVSGFGSGAYSEKLLAGTRQRFFRLSHAHQRGEEVSRPLGDWKPASPWRRRHTPAHHSQLTQCAALRTAPGWGGPGTGPASRDTLTTYRFTSRNRAMIAAWLVRRAAGIDWNLTDGARATEFSVPISPRVVRRTTAQGRINQVTALPRRLRRRHPCR